MEICARTGHNGGGGSAARQLEGHRLLLSEAVSRSVQLLAGWLADWLLSWPSGRAAEQPAWLVANSQSARPTLQSNNGSRKRNTNSYSLRNGWHYIWCLRASQIEPNSSLSVSSTSSQVVARAHCCSGRSSSSSRSSCASRLASEPKSR